MNLRHTMKLRASTLVEMLVLMIVSGVVLLSVFDGFSLFDRLLRRIEVRMEKSTAEATGYSRLEYVFSATDSITGNVDVLQMFRSGRCWTEVVIEDSLLMLHYTGTERPDTLFVRVSQPRLVADRYFPQRTDSLILTNDTTELRFGLLHEPAMRAESELINLEKENDHED